MQNKYLLNKRRGKEKQGVEKDYNEEKEGQK